MSPSRSILITGANAGLGLEIVKSLCASSQQYQIIMAARSMNKATNAIAEIEKLHPTTQTKLVPLALDVESDQSISAAATYIQDKHGMLDVLVNNAGASFEQALAGGTNSMTVREALNKNWDVNVTGAHLLTQAMVPYLLKSPRPYLIFMTSGTCSLAETESDQLWFNKSPPAGWPKPSGIVGYRSCKTGLNMVMRDWHRLLKNDGVLVWGISPGFLATGLGGVGSEKLKEMGAMDPSIGGDFVSEVIEGKRDQDAGKVIHKNGIQPW
jgi:NAD(P)-dependent dehydrogenase (short-subunit alcohol dehydrogenase family)